MHLFYIWNGPFRDVCKHVHAARLFRNANLHSDKELFSRQVKEDLVTYFKNKERVIPTENKNRLIYEGDIDVAYNKIIRLYYLQGGSVFSPKDNISERNSDHFRPPELNTKRTRKILRNTKESTKEEIAYNSTKTQSYHDASNLIHNENSSIVSIYSNTNFQHELYISFH
ncbi:unnamed protein product [Rhizophagus irregularis]|nr:unnamed protein product [Rhizophagus irregularis]